MNYRKSVGARVTLAFATVIVVFGGAVALSIGRLAAFNTGIEQVAGPLLAKVENADGWSIGLLHSMRQTQHALLVDGHAEIQKEIDEVRASDAMQATYADALVATVR